METNLVMSYEWCPVERAPGVLYWFGQTLTPHLRRTYAGPAVYRWRVRPGPEGQAELRYIGETENLPRRLYHYLKPGPSQQTNLRIHRILKRAVQCRARIRIEILNIASCAIDEWSLDTVNLADASLRRCLEELLVVASRRESGVEILNR